LWRAWPIKILLGIYVLKNRKSLVVVVVVVVV
jgi:hypothetical protein